jgi:hypothetical protein
VKHISKNILLIVLLVVLNLLIFLFCKLLTSPENYIWYKTAASARNFVEIACFDLMRIRYFIYANTINVGLLGVYLFFFFRKPAGVLVLLLSAGVYLGGGKLFEEDIARSFYIIFRYQKVSEDFALEPVRSAGYAIGKYLEKDATSRQSPVRQQAIAGLGAIGYSPAAPLLNRILTDPGEQLLIRSEAYRALLRIDTPQTNRYIQDFVEIGDKKENIQVIRQIQMNKFR